MFRNYYFTLFHCCCFAILAATDKNSHKSVQDEGGSDHYNSDTEVEDPLDSNSQGDVHDPSDNIKKAVSIIPKRISRPKRHNSEAVAGPSSREVTRVTVDSEQFSIQSLLDDF